MERGARDDDPGTPAAALAVPGDAAEGRAERRRCKRRATAVRTERVDLHLVLLVFEHCARAARGGQRHERPLGAASRRSCPLRAASPDRSGLPTRLRLRVGGRRARRLLVMQFRLQLTVSAPAESKGRLAPSRMLPSENHRAICDVMLIRLTPHHTTGGRWSAPAGCRGPAVSERPPSGCGGG